MGIEVDPPVVNWNKMLSYKESMIADNTKGIEYLFKKIKLPSSRVGPASWIKILFVLIIKVMDGILCYRNWISKY